MALVLGIDLGTTNTCAAVVTDGGARVVQTKTGQNTMPSVVALTSASRELIGNLAKRQALTNPTNTIYGAKRLIGRRWQHADVQKALTYIPFECNEGPNGDIRITWGERKLSVPEVSAMILGEIKAVAEDFLGESIEGAVITVPAYFNDNQRQATKDAGRIAGLDVLRIINEPTAAALAFGFHKTGLEQKLIVYDLGGGTFDVSILEIGQSVFEVLSTAGDTFLGGEDFDDRIIQWLAKDFEKEHGVDLCGDPMALQRLRDAAEKAKRDLSELDTTSISLPFIFSASDGKTLHLQAELSRDNLESLVSDLVERTLDICKIAIKQAEVELDELGAALLVGGMTRMPMVQKAVEKLFKRPPSKGVHADEAVGLGAAIQGHLLTSGGAETLLLDVTPHDLGIGVAGGLMDVIIPRGTTIPTSAQKTFTTARDGQTQVRIVVFQGVENEVGYNELLGEFLLDGLRDAPRGEVQVEVDFEISSDGIVGVSARDVETGYQQAITVTASSGLTEEEIQTILENSRDLVVASRGADFELLVKQVLVLQKTVQDGIDGVRTVLRGNAEGEQAIQSVNEVLERAESALVSREINELKEIHGALKRSSEYLQGLINQFD